MKHKYAVGECFGGVTVLALLSEGRNNSLYKVSCSCGIEWIISGPMLASIRECPHKPTMGKHPKERRIWVGMLRRCNNPSGKSYSNYGGRGITVCDKWASSFDSFFEDMGPRPEGKSLDRVDNNEGYSKANCRWATPREQSNNRRCTIFLSFSGTNVPLSLVCSSLGVRLSAANYRLKKGYPFLMEVKEYEDLEKKFEGV